MTTLSEHSLDEPLVESAPLARRLALERCGRDPDTGENCAWNHGVWQYLRILDLVTTPVHHAAFFARALERVEERGVPPRVLISGAGDYAILVQVLRAFAARGIVPRVTVVDACDTPLALNEWYASRAGMTIACRRSDVLEYRAAAPYDLVCGHAFFGQFAPAQRMRLMQKWIELLRPGGLVVTVNRIRPHGGTGRTGFTPAQAQAFCAAVAGKARELADRLPATSEELALWATEYATRQSAYSITRLEELAELFEAGGFRLEHLSSAAIVTGATPALTGPTTPGGAEFASVIARRPLAS